MVGDNKTLHRQWGWSVFFFFSYEFHLIDEDNQCGKLSNQEILHTGSIMFHTQKYMLLCIIAVYPLLLFFPIYYHFFSWGGFYFEFNQNRGNTTLHITEMGPQRVPNQFLLDKHKNQKLYGVDEMWTDGGIKCMKAEGLEGKKKV